MTQINILGLNPSGKVPGAKWAVQFGQGRVSVGSIPRYLLLVGNKVTTDISVTINAVTYVASNAGTATADTVVYDITPDIDADALFGARSELSKMIAAARRYTGVRIKAIACAEVSAGSPVSASATITIATTSSSAGTWTYYIDGVAVPVTIASGRTVTQQAVDIANAINNSPNLSVYATNSAGVVTVTFTHPGTRGNECTIYQDVSEKPGASTSTLATASTYTVNPGPGGVTGVRLGGGTGTDSVTNVLAALDGNTYFTIAFAQIDTTNAALIKTYNDSKAALGSQRYEHVVLGYNGLLASANTLSDAINKERFQLVHQQGGESQPCVIAASMGGLRTQKEQSHPNRRYLTDALLGVAPQRALADLPSASETGTQQSALDNGITPVTTTPDGTAVCVRAITTKHLKTVGNLTIDFYGTLDVGQARSPDVFAEELELAWITDYGANNEYVDDDPAAGEPNRPSGVATPRTWTGYAQNLGNQKIAANWFSSVEIASEYDATNKQILCSIQVEPTPLNYRIAGNIAQTVGS